MPGSFHRRDSTFVTQCQNLQGRSGTKYFCCFSRVFAQNIQLQQGSTTLARRWQLVQWKKNDQGYFHLVDMQPCSTPVIYWIYLQIYIYICNYMYIYMIYMGLQINMCNQFWITYCGCTSQQCSKTQKTSPEKSRVHVDRDSPHGLWWSQYIGSGQIIIFH